MAPEEAMPPQDPRRARPPRPSAAARDGSAEHPAPTATGTPPSGESGTHGYSAATERYPSSGESPACRAEPAGHGEVPAADTEPDGSAEHLAAASAPPTRWGPRELAEIIEGQEFDRFGLPVVRGSRRRAEEPEPPGGWMPGEELDGAAVGTAALAAPRKQRQVNIKLDHWQYDRLTRAAELYGSKPTTLARLFVNRGAQAVVNAHYREALLGDDG